MSIFDEHIEDLVPITHSYLKNNGWYSDLYVGYELPASAPIPTYEVYTKRFNGNTIEATLYLTIDDDCRYTYKLKLYSFITHSHIYIHHYITFTEGLELMLQKYELT